jgi:hypothetical protein
MSSRPSGRRHYVALLGVSLSFVCLDGRLVVAATGPNRKPPNGISVGRPKIFDNRALTLMLGSHKHSYDRRASRMITARGGCRASAV